MPTQVDSVTRELNGASSEGWETWPQVAEVKARMNVGQPELNRYVLAGNLTRFQCPDGTFRYRPNEVAKLVELHIAGKTGAQIDAERQRSETELTAVLARAIGLLKVSQDHIEKLFANATNPIAKGTQFLLDINTQQAARLRYLEEQHDAMILLREQMLSTEHDRMLKSKRAEATQQTMKAAVSTIGNAMAPLAMQIAKNLGVELPVKHPGLELLNSIDPVMLVTLGQMGMLTPFQIEKCRELWPEMDWDSKPEPESESVPTEPSGDAVAASPAPPPAPAPPAPPAPPAATAQAETSAAPPADPRQPDLPFPRPQIRRRPGRPPKEKSKNGTS